MERIRRIGRRAGIVVALVVALVVVMLATPAWAQADPPADVGGFDQVIAFAVAIVVAFGPGARGLTWIVDRVRDALPDRISDDNRYRILWPLLAFVIAIASCLAFEDLNVIGEVLAATFPGGGGALSGTVGSIVSAIGYAGFASYWHDHDVANNPPGARRLNGHTASPS